MELVRLSIWHKNGEGFGENSNEVGLIELLVERLVIHATTSITIYEVARITHAILIL